MIDGRRWRVRLTASADADYRNILRWTAEHYGTQQARSYAETLASAIEELTEGPEVPRSANAPTSEQKSGCFTSRAALLVSMLLANGGYECHWRASWTCREPKAGWKRTPTKVNSVWTHAMIELVDDAVGGVLGAFDQSRQRDNTLIPSISDHEEVQGDDASPCSTHRTLSCRIRCPQ